MISKKGHRNTTEMEHNDTTMLEDNNSNMNPPAETSAHDSSPVTQNDTTNNAGVADIVSYYYIRTVIFHICTPHWTTF